MLKLTIGDGGDDVVDQLMMRMTMHDGFTSLLFALLLLWLKVLLGQPSANLAVLLLLLVV